MERYEIYFLPCMDLSYVVILILVLFLLLSKFIMFHNVLLDYFLFSRVYHHVSLGTNK